MDTTLEGKSWWNGLSNTPASGPDGPRVKHCWSQRELPEGWEQNGSTISQSRSADRFHLRFCFPTISYPDDWSRNQDCESMCSKMHLRWKAACSSLSGITVLGVCVDAKPPGLFIKRMATDFTGGKQQECVLFVDLGKWKTMTHWLLGSSALYNKSLNVAESLMLKVSKPECRARCPLPDRG